MYWIALRRMSKIFVPPVPAAAMGFGSTGEYMTEYK